MSSVYPAWGGFGNRVAVSVSIATVELIGHSSPCLYFVTTSVNNLLRMAVIKNKQMLAGMWASWDFYFIFLF